MNLQKLFFLDVFFDIKSWCCFYKLGHIYLVAYKEELIVETWVRFWERVKFEFRNYSIFGFWECFDSLIFSSWTFNLSNYFCNSRILALISLDSIRGFCFIKIFFYLFSRIFIISALFLFIDSVLSSLVEFLTPFVASWEYNVVFALFWNRNQIVLLRPRNWLVDLELNQFF